MNPGLRLGLIKRKEKKKKKERKEGKKKGRKEERKKGRKEERKTAFDVVRFGGKNILLPFLRIRCSSPKNKSQQHRKQLEEICAEMPQLKMISITNIFIRIICIAPNGCKFCFFRQLCERLFHCLLATQRLMYADYLRAKLPSEPPSKQGSLAS